MKLFFQTKNNQQNAGEIILLFANDLETPVQGIYNNLLSINATLYFFLFIYLFFMIFICIISINT